MNSSGLTKPFAGTWLGRPVTALCILLGISFLSVALLAGRDRIPLRKTGAPGYTVILRHYGIDAREMERTAAIPLEDALSALNGVKHILSSSENGRARVFVRFDRDVPGLYEAVGDAVQRVYETLPPSAQRPEILSSDDTRIPVWVAVAFSAGSGGGAEIPVLGEILERSVKPALEGLEGVGEVEISGAGLSEIVITLKDEETAARGLSPSAVAGLLGQNDLLLPAGRLRQGETDTLVMVDSRYPDTAALAGAYLSPEGGEPVRLGEIAGISERDRRPDTLSRLDGKKTAVISIMAGSDADLGALSRRIQGELKTFADLPLELKVLSDRGAEERAAFRSVLEAALQGIFMTALAAALLGGNIPGAAFFGRNRRRKRGSPGPALVCLFTVPFICLVSAALLALLGFPLNRTLLGGLSAGAGAGVDAAILHNEGLRGVRSPREGRAALGKIRVSLISGSVTTLAALLPLTAMDVLSADIGAVAWAVGAVNLAALLSALTLLPPLLLWGAAGADLPALAVPADKPRGKLLSALAAGLGFLVRRCFRLGARLLAAHIRGCLKRPGLSLLPAVLLSAGGILALALAGADTGLPPPEDSVYAQMEFEGGFLAEKGDQLLGAYAEDLAGTGGIKNVQTSARTGSGSLLVTFDPKKIKAGEVRNLLREKKIPGGFVYISETAPGERIWEITLSGDDDRVCRELAEEKARLAAAAPFVRETVLNFKAGGPGLTLLPDRERLEEGGFRFAEAAETARWGVHGPVAYKRLDSQGETDVRIRSREGASLSRKETGELLLTGRGEGGNIRPLMLNRVMEQREGLEPSSISRENRRRAASFSVRTKSEDPRKVRDKLMEFLGDPDLPRGYTIEFDREAIRAAEALSETAGFFLLALLFCAMVIAAVNESLGIPLAVLSVVPPSLAVPAIFMVLRGYPINAAAACAFVAVSGMAVNASVLCADEIRRLSKQGGTGSGGEFYRALRKRLPALLATTVTTVAGAMPFLFLREGSNTVIRALSLVTALGVGASAIFSLTLIPALAKIFPKIFAGH
ncbi:MAG: efflux RND transporter permease subunit [Treponema sp.]|jgi:multidrug efflux pump subunit AcrB|nr:efflux RND transporter permease subunit [Treponema sp.]